MTAILVRAVASIRSRPGPAIAAALGLFFAGAILGSAVTTRHALTTGLGRAQTVAGTPDITAHFDPVDLRRLETRLTAIANVSRWTARISARPVPISVRRPGGSIRAGTAEADGVFPAKGITGVAIVAGRSLSGRAGEVVVERGLFRDWQLALGQVLTVGTRRGPLDVTIVGVSIEPDGVAFPLASRPRIYLPYETVQDTISSARGRRPVTDVAIFVTDGGLLPVTLAQLRAASFGIGSVTVRTRTGIRVAIDEAAGLIAAVLTAFAGVALAAAIVMIAAASQARVTRDLPSIGALRALGFSSGGIAATYAAEAGLIALFAGGAGVVAGSFAVAGQAGVLLESFNELAPPHTLGTVQLGVVLAAVLGAGLAAAVPAYLAARRPVVELLRGAGVARTTTLGVARGGSFLLGARLVAARPVRLAASVVAVAGGLAVVLVLVSLARTLLAARDDPRSLGVRYALLVDDAPGVLATVRSTPGVAAAAVRYSAVGVHAYDLAEPLHVVAFGAGGAAVFDGRPLVSGRRPTAPGETDVGEGLATTLGVGPGQILVADLDGGGEVRLQVVGVVREPTFDGRVAYTDAATLLAAQPSLPGQVAVRPTEGTPTAVVVERLARAGVQASTATGLVPADAAFVAAVVALLRAVAVVNGAGSVALALLAIIVLARERAATIAVIRAVGGSRRHVAALLAGAAVTVVGSALLVAAVLNRIVLEPLTEHLLGTYGALRVALAGGDLALVAGLALAATVVASSLVAARYAALTVRSAFDAE